MYIHQLKQVCIIASIVSTHLKLNFVHFVTEKLLLIQASADTLVPSVFIARALKQSLIESKVFFLRFRVIYSKQSDWKQYLHDAALMQPCFCFFWVYQDYEIRDSVFNLLVIVNVGKMASSSLGFAHPVLPCTSDPSHPSRFRCFQLARNPRAELYELR